jgi:hypothetical protein
MPDSMKRLPVEATYSASVSCQGRIRVEGVLEHEIREGRIGRPRAPGGRTLSLVVGFTGLGRVPEGHGPGAGKVEPGGRPGIYRVVGAEESRGDDPFDGHARSRVQVGLPTWSVTTSTLPFSRRQAQDGFREARPARAEEPGAADDIEAVVQVAGVLFARPLGPTVGRHGWWPSNST